jgi:predicted nucleic acid-binding protein
MLLDTSGLLCYHHKDEPWHNEAVQYLTAAPVLVTHNYILAEFVALAQARRIPRAGVLDFVAELQASNIVETVFVDRALHQDALDLLVKRADKTWSLCDAVSFILMQSRGLRKALTTDHHFEQAGFVGLLRP